MKTWVLIAGVTLLTACNGGATTPPSGGADITGTYAGSFNIGGSNPFVSETVTLTIDAAGKVAGVTTGGPTSGARGEKGSLTGTISGTVTNLQADLTFTSATRGTYTAKGSGGVYDASGKEIAVQVNASKGGVFVGPLILVVKQ